MTAQPPQTIPPAEPAEIRRKLLFGVALVFAMVSMYAGIFNWGRGLQYGLALGAMAIVLVALLTGSAAKK